MSQPALSRYWSETENQGRGYLRPSTGERVPGVTSITGLVDKNLAQYGADKTIEWMVQNWHQWNPGGKSDEAATNHAKYRWKDHRNERGAIGTDVHNYIEDTILGRGPFLEELDAEQQMMVLNWEDFNFTTGIEYTHTEAQVWGGDYAGTLDAYGKMYSDRLGRMANGIVDWKTSKACYYEYFMQLAGLKNADFRFEELTDPGIIEAAKLAGLAHPAEQKTDNSIVTTWWVEEPQPEVETAWIVHLTSDGWDVFELDSEELHLARFNAYKAAWWAEKHLKEQLSPLGKKLDRPISWTDPKKKGV